MVRIRLTFSYVIAINKYCSFEECSMIRYSREYLEALLGRVDIVEVIRSFLPMRRTRGGDYVTLCPFHAEKRPSFKVMSRKQFYYCHACGASGHAIKFLMEHQKLTYPGAIRWLANRYRFYQTEWLRKCRQRARRIQQKTK